MSRSKDLNFNIRLISDMPQILTERKHSVHISLYSGFPYILTVFIDQILLLSKSATCWKTINIRDFLIPKLSNIYSERNSGT